MRIPYRATPPEEPGLYMVNVNDHMHLVRVIAVERDGKTQLCAGIGFVHMPVDKLTGFTWSERLEFASTKTKSNKA